MIKVITYGTFDFLHYGHIRLLERAKALGDYLIVGVTADNFDKARGKINVQQSLIERIDAIKKTGLADQIIVEEYEGQKIDDITKYRIDIFTVGSDWKGTFDYLNKYCKVIYLDRTQGVSSSDIRSSQKEIRLGLIGETTILNKFKNECKFVNGILISSILASSEFELDEELSTLSQETSAFEDLSEECDAVYIASIPQLHYQHCKQALEHGLHVLCESPIAMNLVEFKELVQLSTKNGLVLMDGIKTAYSVAFNRMLLLINGGIIGDILSVDTTCTSLSNLEKYGKEIPPYIWNSITAWGPTALLPIFDILGEDYNDLQLSTKTLNKNPNFDLFTKGSFVYNSGVASFKVGQGVKSEGEMIISGTNGYIYVPAPWWKTDYFEVRYENQSNNKRYFYQLEGEGIRNEILSFLRYIEGDSSANKISYNTSGAIVKIMQRFNDSNFNKLI